MDKQNASEWKIALSYRFSSFAVGFFGFDNTSVWSWLYKWTV